MQKFRFYLILGIILSGTFSLKAQLVIDSLNETCGFETAFSRGVTRGSPITNPSLQQIVQNNFNFVFHTYFVSDPESIVIEQADNSVPLEWKYAAADVRQRPDGRLERVIYFDNVTLDQTFLTMGAGWALKTVLLHEIGHHNNWHQFRSMARKDMELAADEFAGVHLSRMKLLGVSVDSADAFTAINRLTSLNGKNGYPNRSERIASFNKGWQLGKLPLFHSPLYAIATTISQNKNHQINKMGEFMGGILANKQYSSIESDIDRDTVARVKSKSLNRKFLIKSDALLYSQGRDTYAELGKITDTDRPGYKKMITDKMLFVWYIANDDNIYFLADGQKILIGKVDQ